MINKLSAALLAGALSLIATRPLQAQSPQDKLFVEGQQFFLRKNYAMTDQVLTQYLNGPIQSDNRQEAEYMLAYANFMLSSDKNIQSLYNYLDKYPDTPHANRIRALIASAYYDRHDYEACIATFDACNLAMLPDDERDEYTCRLGTANLKTGKLSDAAIWFHTLEASSPNYRNKALYYLAYIDYRKGNYEDALQTFLHLQTLPEFEKNTPYYIAEIKLQQQQYDQARKIALRYLDEYTDNEYQSEMQRIAGTANYYLRQYNAATQALQQYADATETPQRNTCYLLGMAYYQTQVYSRAADWLGKVTENNDALAQNAYLHRGLSYLQLQDKAKARMAFEQAAAMPFDPTIEEEALYNYALCIHETAYSPFAESVTVFERFLNQFPESAHRNQVNDYLIEVYMNTRSYEAALASIAKIARPDNRILEAKQKILFQLGIQFFANARFEEAIAHFNRSLQLSRFSLQTKAETHFWRGESYYRLNRFAEAANDYLLYLEFTTDKAQNTYTLALYNMGYTRFKQKKYSDAQNWFTRYTEQPKANNKTKADAYNRLGDCHFYARQFPEARQAYAQAIQLDDTQGDYSLYQEAFVLGLQKDYLGKIHTLNKLIGGFPSSSYQANAYYERGRAYVMFEDNNRAIESFRQLTEKFPQTAIARKGANEIGLLYYQNDRNKEAIEAYKHVILTYPGSEEAKLAQRDLKSIYIDLNQVDAYANFVSSIPGSANFDVNERDSLTYIAAEKAYMRGETAQANTSFIHYLQNFPEGAFSLNAHYYLGLTGYNRQQYAEALAHFQKVLEFPDNKFSEEAMILSAEIQFNQRAYAQALDIYKQWMNKASTTDRRITAITGVLRSAYLLQNNPETIQAADLLLQENKLSPELANEARYYRAKAYLTEQNTAKAITDLSWLASDTRNVYGAEAKYQLAQLYFNTNQTENAEQEVLDYIELSTPHTYWLARSFVLLADIYMTMGRNLDAKQYLLSLQQNYDANDDIASRIDERLQKLNKQ